MENTLPIELMSTPERRYVAIRRGRWSVIEIAVLPKSSRSELSDSPSDGWHRIVSPNEIRPEMKPMITPSIIKGQQINVLVAPTDFITWISIFLETIVILIVFEMINIETKARTITTIIQIAVTDF